MWSKSGRRVAENISLEAEDNSSERTCMDPMLGMGPSPPIGAVLSSPVFSPETPAGAAFSLPDFVSSDVEEEADVKVGAEGAASGGVEESLLVAVDGSGVLKPSKTNRLASRRRARALTRVSWHISEPTVVNPRREDQLAGQG